jgi:hypothetical protein
VRVDYAIFKNLRPPDPGRPRAVYEIGDLDFALLPGGAAIDAGCRLANLNGDYWGTAPDLRASESWPRAPGYGRRR